MPLHPNQWDADKSGYEFDLPKWAIVNESGRDLLHIGGGKFVSAEPAPPIELLIPRGEPEQPRRYDERSVSLQFIGEFGDSTFQRTLPVSV
jgi:hypothetical protein